MAPDLGAFGVHNASGKLPRRQTLDKSGDCAYIIQAMTAGECGRLLLFTVGGRNLRPGAALAHRGLVMVLSRLLKVVRVDFCKSLLWKSWKSC